MTLSSQLTLLPCQLSRVITSHTEPPTHPPTQNQVLPAHHSIFQVFLTFRPWHDALVIAQSHAITLINKKGGLGG